MDETPDEYAWMMNARCRGASPTDFFPSDGLGVESAQEICVHCTVRAECLEYALVNRIEHGVWGGASERERRRILRRRRDLLPSTPAEPQEEVHASSNSSTSSADEIWNGTAPAPRISVSMPSSAHEPT